MKCPDFAATVGDLARSELMEASTRDAAERHAAECDGCRERLLDERSIVEGFVALAQADQEKVATRWNETDLRAAFRAHRIEEQHQAAQVSQGVERRGMRIAMAVAAGLIVLLGGVVAWRMVGTASQGPAPILTARPSESEREDDSAKPTHASDDPMRRIAAVEEATVAPRQKRSRRRPIVRKAADSSYVVASVSEFRPLTNEAEVLSDFLPLVPGSEVTPLARGQVVRVVMPSSAMAYFGLPVNVDRTDRQVKADVLFGEDNLARAIRFVR